VLAALVDLGRTDLTVEARMAEQAFRAVAGRIPTELPACVSGRELVDGGFPDDVQVAAELDASDVVPVLDGEAFRDVS
jgi:2-phosphosulfolactate phosphatase